MFSVENFFCRKFFFVENFFCHKLFFVENVFFLKKLIFSHRACSKPRRVLLIPSRRRQPEKLFFIILCSILPLNVQPSRKIIKLSISEKFGPILNWRRFLEGLGLFLQKFRFLNYLPHDELHISLKRRNSEIGEHLSFFNYWPKIFLRSHENSVNFGILRLI